MGLGDFFGGAVGGLIDQATQGAMPELVKNALGQDGLNDVLAKLKTGGLGDVVASWLDANKTSLPITAEQLQAALGNEYVKKIAEAVGLPLDKVLAVLAQYLPHVAEAAAADGSVSI